MKRQHAAERNYYTCRISKLRMFETSQHHMCRCLKHRDEHLWITEARATMKRGYRVHRSMNEKEGVTRAEDKVAIAQYARARPAITFQRFQYGCLPDIYLKKAPYWLEMSEGRIVDRDGRVFVQILRRKMKFGRWTPAATPK